MRWAVYEGVVSKSRGPIRAEIPDLPPSLWTAYKTRRGGGKCLSQKARDWKDFATIHLLRARPRKPLTGHVSLDIVLVAKDNRRWDVENRVKVLSDLLTEMQFWGDDSQVWDLRVRREPGKVSVTKIEITPIGEEV